MSRLHPSTLEVLSETDMVGGPLALSFNGRFCVSTGPFLWEPASETQVWVAGNLLRGENFVFHPNGRWLIQDIGLANYFALDTWTRSFVPFGP